MLKRIGIPMLLVISLLLLFYKQNLNWQLELPSQGWSRSHELPMKFENAIEYYKGTGEKKGSIYISKNGALNQYVISSLFGVRVSEHSNIQVPENTKFWSNGKKAIYFDSGKVVLVTKSSKEILEMNVDGLESRGDHLLFWKGNQLFSIDVNKNRILSVGSFKDQIQGISIDEQSGDVLICESKYGTELNFSILQKDKQIQLKSIAMIGRESIQKIEFIKFDTEYHIYYESEINAQGKRSSKFYEWNVSLDGKDIKTPTQMVIVEGKTQLQLSEPSRLNVEVSNGIPQLLFSHFGPTGGKREGYNVYLATKENDDWIAKRISTTEGVPKEIVKINDNTIIWNVYQNDEYSWYGASTLIKNIKESQKVTGEDYSLALYYSITYLAGSFLFILFAMGWISIPLIIGGWVYFFKTDELDNGKVKWLLPLIAGVYTFIQVYTFVSMVNLSSFTIAPSYINFPGFYYLIPIINAGVSYGLLLLLRNKEWGIFKDFGYFVMVNILILMSLFGPYII